MHAHRNLSVQTQTNASIKCLARKNKTQHTCVHTLHQPRPCRSKSSGACTSFPLASLSQNRNSWLWSVDSTATSSPWLPPPSPPAPSWPNAATPRAEKKAASSSEATPLACDTGGGAKPGGAEIRPVRSPWAWIRQKYMRLAPDALLPPSLTCGMIRVLPWEGYEDVMEDIANAWVAEKITAGLGAMGKTLQPRLVPRAVPGAQKRTSVASTDKSRRTNG